MSARKILLGSSLATLALALVGWAAQGRARPGPAAGRGALGGQERGAPRGGGDEQSRAPEVDLGLADAYFRICDYDGNGWVSYREARQSLEISRARFGAYDQNRDGRVELEEFRAVYATTVARFGSFKPPLSKDGAPVAVAEDAGRSATAGPRATSVLALFGQPEERANADEITPLPPRIPGPVPLFRRLDLDDDGLITSADLQELQRPVQLPVRINTVLATLDLDGDGGISADELHRAMR